MADYSEAYQQFKAIENRERRDREKYGYSGADRYLDHAGSYSGGSDATPSSVGGADATPQMKAAKRANDKMIAHHSHNKKFCDQCGIKVAVNWKFCSDCGVKL